MASLVMLRDEMGTRFMINSLTQRFRACMERCAKNGDTVDVSGCRFGPECVSIMHGFYGTIDFCNSEDEYLDSVLKNNCVTARQHHEDYEVLPLKDVKDLDKFIALSQSLPTGAKLCPDVDLTSLQSKAILILLIMTRPDIEWDIRSCSTDVFDFVRDLWLSSAKHHEQYSELIAPNITTRTVREDGLYGDRNYGFMKERDFIRSRKVLPIEFGNSQIIILDANKGVDDEWLAVVEKCLNLFNTVKQGKRVPGKTVKDFLTFREDD